MVLDGLSAAADLDDSYLKKYEVILQQNAAGERRAIIRTFTVQHDREGNTLISPSYGYLNSKGDYVQTPVRYQNYPTEWIRPSKGAAVIAQPGG